MCVWMEIDRCECAWAAGFFDGEGWANAVKNRNRWQPHAQINQSSRTGVPNVLLRFRTAVGVGRVRGPKLEEGREPLYSWVASRRGDVARVYELLVPWLGEVKRAEFYAALGLHGDAADAGHQCSELEEIGWAAGVFDGEGSVYLAKHQSHAGYFTLEAAVTQSGIEGVPELLARFCRIARVGCIYGPFAPHSEKWRPVYRWKAFGIGQVAPLIERLRPWLGPIKRSQADDVFSVVRSQAPLRRGNPAWGYHKTRCVNGHEYATARLRAFVPRKGGAEKRASKQCLACLREHARMKRLKKARRA